MFFSGIFFLSFCLIFLSLGNFQIEFSTFEGQYRKNRLLVGPSTRPLEKRTCKESHFVLLSSLDP